MNRGQLAAQVIAIGFAAALGGCAILPGEKAVKHSQPVVEHDMLAAAAEDVEAAHWPRPENAPIFSWITGGGDQDRVSRSDAIDYYMTTLEPAGARFASLMEDASDKLEEAWVLHDAAEATASSMRVSINDVASVEAAIQSLREHREIYAATAKALEKSGETIDKSDVDAMRKAFSSIVRELGDKADDLADRLEEDQAPNYAGSDARLPDPSL